MDAHYVLRSPESIYFVILLMIFQRFVWIFFWRSLTFNDNHICWEVPNRYIHCVLHCEQYLGDIIDIILANMRYYKITEITQQWVNDKYVSSISKL